MAKKFTYYDRKRFLDARQSGLSDTDLKRKFGITDNRTLRRHLKLAEQEEEARLVKVTILRDALSTHLTEIRTLIDEWKNSLSTPRVESIYFDMSPRPTQSIEANPLFGSLKEHLPFPTLWKNYSIWRNKVKDYINGCQRVMKEISESEKSSVSADILKEWGTESVTTALALSEPFYRMMKKYKEATKVDSELRSIIEQIKPIEAKLHESLQEIQLRHDHIMYTCKLCPGQPRLSR